MMILSILVIVLFAIDSILNVMLLRIYRKKPKSVPIIAYKCDETLTCNKYCRDGEARSCYHTLNVKHAANFEEIEPGLFAEKTERETED